MSDIYLVITPNGLKGSISSLIKQKEARGYEVVVKAVEDFINRPQAPYVLMREYVLNKKPKCLLLVGDYDRTPGYPLETPDATTYLSDAYFSMQSNDPVPQIPTGRLSSNNPYELENICELLVSYPNDPDPRWKRRVILTGWIPRGPDCSDMNCEEDAGWACVNEIGEYYEILKRFENDKTIENDVSSPLGNGARRREIWEVKGTSKQDLIDAIEEGALIVRYLGHGSPNAWHNIGIHNDVDEQFGINDVKTLNVGNKLPLVISATCFTGHIRASPSFSEAWQKYRKAIGVFAADVISATYWNDRITQLIFHEIVSCQKGMVGEVLVDAMKRLYEKYGNLNAFSMRTFRMYRYLGDPDTILAKPEDCFSFDYQRTEAMEIDGRWYIVVGSMALMSFGSSEAEARKALRIIQHYRMNEVCYVGRPDASMEYYLVDGKAPAGSFAGEDCFRFNPAAIEVKNIGGRWKIVEGDIDHWFLDFGDKEDKARTAFEIIKKYGFNHMCYVGRPDASMIYFRKELLVVSGVVMDMGSGVEKIQGVRITFVSEDGSVIEEVTTDNRGSYRTSLSEGRYVVTATHPDYEDYSTAPGFLVVGEGYQTFNIDMKKLEREGVVQGAVYEKRSWVKLQGVKITFVSEDGSVIEEVTTDNRGSYRISLSKGRYEASATHPDYEDYSTAPGFLVAAGEGYQTFNIFMKKLER